MQDLVGIVRRGDEMERALDGYRKTETARRQGRRSPAIANTIPGWHTALDLTHLLTVSEAVARAGLNARKAGAHTSATTIRRRIRAFATFNFVIRKGAAGAMQVEREPLPPMTEEEEADYRKR